MYSHILEDVLTEVGEEMRHAVAETIFMINP